MSVSEIERAMTSTQRDDVPVAVRRLGIKYHIKGQMEPFVAVKSVSFDVRKGELVAVVGPSGCGKSSLIGAISGLVPYAAGSVYVGSERVEGPSEHLGVVFQRALLLPWKSVVENVAISLAIARVSKAERVERAMEMLKMVGLVDFAERYPHELSGGMQQRVNLARALVRDPDVLLLDEPFASLDAQTREEMQEELMKIWTVAGKSGLFITHQIDEAVYLADRVLVMSAGPASVLIDEVKIDFPRPRTLHLKREPEFQELVDYIWGKVRLKRDEAVES